VLAGANRYVLAAMVLGWSLTLFLVLSEGEGAPQPLAASPYDEVLIGLDRAALEQSYIHQVDQLFGVWMRDPTGQPARALKGVRQAKKAFIDAMTAIDKRETELQKDHK
jgi:hypothetical protein